LKAVTLGGAAMEDYTIIQGQTMLVILFAFLLTAISFYLWTSWKAQTGSVKAPHPKPVFFGLQRVHPTEMALKRGFLRIQSRVLRVVPKNIGEWVAPLVACLVVLMVSSAIVVALLGD